MKRLNSRSEMKVRSNSEYWIIVGDLMQGDETFFLLKSQKKIPDDVAVAINLCTRCIDFHLPVNLDV